MSSFVRCYYFDWFWASAVAAPFTAIVTSVQICQEGLASFPIFLKCLFDWHETARIYVETPRQDEDGTVLGDDGSWLQCYCEDGKGRRIPVRTLYGKEWNVYYISLVIFGDAWWQFWIVMVVACWHRLSLRQQGIWAYFINCDTHTLCVPSNNILFNLRVLYVVAWIGRTSCIQRTTDAIVSVLLSTKSHGARALHVYLGLLCSCHPFLSLKISC